MQSDRSGAVGSKFIGWLKAVFRRDVPSPWDDIKRISGFGSNSTADFDISIDGSSVSIWYLQLGHGGRRDTIEVRSCDDSSIMKEIQLSVPLLRFANCPDGTILLATQQGLEIRDTSGARKWSHKLDFSLGDVVDLAITNDNTHIAVLREQEVILLRVRDKSVVYCDRLVPKSSRGDTQTACIWAPKGDILFITRTTGSLFAISLDTLQGVAFPISQDCLSDLSLSASGDILAVSAYRCVYVYDLSKCLGSPPLSWSIKPRFKIERADRQQKDPWGDLRDYFRTVSISPCGSYVVCGDSQGRMSWWKARDGEYAFELDCGTGPKRQLFSSCGSRWAVLSRDEFRVYGPAK